MISIQKNYTEELKKNVIQRIQFIISSQNKTTQPQKKKSLILKREIGDSFLSKHKMKKGGEIPEREREGGNILRVM